VILDCCTGAKAVVGWRKKGKAVTIRQATIEVFQLLTGECTDVSDDLVHQMEVLEGANLPFILRAIRIV
jgi:hypothetical protein